MARTWPTPACATGACVVTWHLTSWWCGTPFAPPDGYNLHYDQWMTGCQSNLTEAQCNAQGEDYTFNFAPSQCGGAVSTVVVYTRQWHRGADCCAHSLFPGDGDCNIGGQCSKVIYYFGGGYQPCNSYDECVQSYIRNCNLGYCLPATQTDPVECYNLNGACAGAAGGTRVPWTTGDPNRPVYCRSISDDRCVSGVGCCLCNRFCTLPQSTCESMGGLVTTQASCAASNRKPACRKGYWKRGIRPSQHRTGMTRPIGNGVALHSKQRGTKDTDTLPEPCRTTYGWTQRHATRGMVHGMICNTFNRGCPTQSRTTRKLKLVRHPTRGIMRMEGKYRRPCPEETEMGCATKVNCTT